MLLRGEEEEVEEDKEVRQGRRWEEKDVKEEKKNKEADRGRDEKEMRQHS